MNKKLNLVLLSALSLGIVTGCTDKGLEEAIDYLKTNVVSEVEVTASDYELTNSFSIGEETYNVAWDVVVAEGGIAGAVKKAETATEGMTGIDVTYTLDLNTAKTDYILKATVSNAKGKSKVVEFRRNVPKFEFTTLSEFEALADASSKSPAVVKGKIIAYYKYGPYIQDANGDCFYCYNVDGGLDAMKVESKLWPIGTEIIATGTATKYSGQYEFSSGVKVSKVADAASDYKVTYVDITNTYTNAASMSDAALLKYVNKPVEIKGVTLAEIDESQRYCYFNIGENKTYFRPYNGWYNSKTLAAFTDAEMNSLQADWKMGYTATLRGLGGVYNNKFYISPFDTTAETKTVEITSRVLNDAGKAAADVTLALTNVPKQLFAMDTSFVLPTAGENGSTLSYAVTGDGAALSDVEGGKKLTLTQQATEKSVTLTVTGTCNGKTYEKDLAITLAAKRTDSTTLTAAQAGAEVEKLNASNKEISADYYYVKLTIDEIYNDQYLNAYIPFGSEEKKLNLYGLYDGKDGGKTRYGVKYSGLPFGEGAEVVVYTQLQHYSTKADGLELVNAQLVEVLSSPKYSVTVDKAAEGIKTCTLTNQTEIAGGSKIEFKVEAEDGYEVSVKNGEKALTPDKDGNYTVYAYTDYTISITAIEKLNGVKLK